MKDDWSEYAWDDVIDQFDKFEDIFKDEIVQIIIIGKNGSIQRIIIKKYIDEWTENSWRYVG